MAGAWYCLFFTARRKLVYWRLLLRDYIKVSHTKWCPVATYHFAFNKAFIRMTQLCFEMGLYLGQDKMHTNVGGLIRPTRSSCLPISIHTANSQTISIVECLCCNAVRAVSSFLLRNFLLLLRQQYVFTF